MYIISKMVCQQRHVPLLFNPVAAETLKDAKAAVKYNIENVLKKDYKVKKTTTTKNKQGKKNECTVIVDFADGGFAIYRIDELFVVGSTSKPKESRRSTSADLDSVEEAVEDARYIAEVNDYILTH